MIDPEDLHDRRRDREPKQVPHDQAPAEQNPGHRQTVEMLNRWREGDDMVGPVRWLARWRSDRHTFEAIATDEGLDVATVRAGIDRALVVEGSSLALAEAARRRPRVVLGRGLTRQQAAIDEQEQAAEDRRQRFLHEMHGTRRGA